MRIIPLTLRESNAYVADYHRHHAPVQGCKFCIGAEDSRGELCGVAIVGRPVSRHLDDGYTAEVTRLCTDGTWNACSFLYAACARIARAMGFHTIITYILASESGISLIASGWICEGIRGGGNWNVPGRPRANSPMQEKKFKYYKELNP